MKIYFHETTTTTFLCQLVDGQLVQSPERSYLFEFDSQEETEKLWPTISRSALKQGFQVSSGAFTWKRTILIDEHLMDQQRPAFGVAAFGEQVRVLEKWVLQLLQQLSAARKAEEQKQ
jgi:hypothetical protein